jgi:tetratricopeptide (TPR) repeat protein
MIDRDIHLARALLIESNALLRSVANGQLRDLGVGEVVSAQRVKDARLLLEHERFDIVICNREFEGSDYSGQDLLDELRREKLLPHSTVFLMVVEQATYSQVQEAAEAALDGFLVRPYTGAALGARLTEARKRKRELGDVLRALDAGKTEVALVHAIKRFQEQQPYWVWCGRLAAELLLGLHRADDARKIFERLAQAVKDGSWARLGQARALTALGEHSAARKLVAEVLAADAASADAHDLMGRILVEQCDFDGALMAYRSAAELTPGCVLRTQQAGALAFYQGESDEALKWLERTLSLGLQSKLFDPLSLLLITLLRFDRGDAVGTAAMREQLKRFRERAGDSPRLLRLEQGAVALSALAGGKQELALETLRALAAEAGQDAFDLESANMLLALWSRMPEALCPAVEHEALVERIAMRFCVSKAIGEVLVASARRSEQAVGVVRRCQAQISALGEQAMDRTLKGDAGAAVQGLLEAGERTLNAKLLEMAGLIARRNSASLADAEALGERAATLLRRSCQAGNHIAGIQRSGRSPGGLQMRGAAPQEARPAAA